MGVNGTSLSSSCEFVDQKLRRGAQLGTSFVLKKLVEVCNLPTLLYALDCLQRGVVGADPNNLPILGTALLGEHEENTGFRRWTRKCKVGK